MDSKIEVKEFIYDKSIKPGDTINVEGNCAFVAVRSSVCTPLDTQPGRLDTTGLMIRVERLIGEALGAALEDVARLRIEVFRDWPYLYDGDEAYERAYLQTYRESADAILVGAFVSRRPGSSWWAPTALAAGIAGE